MICAYASIILLQLFGGSVLVLSGHDKRLSAARSIISVIAVSCVASGFSGVSLIRRFETFSAFFEKLKSSTLVYQDTQYLALTVIAGTALILIFSFCLRRLIDDGRTPLSRAQENLIILLILVCAVFCAMSYKISEDSRSSLKLTGLHGDGSLKMVGDSFTTKDYIILKNTGELTADLADMYLSDREGKPYKLSLEGYILAPQEELYLIMDETAPFSINSGETVFLSDKGGRIYDSLTFIPDEDITLPVPELSAQSGFYPEPFELTLTCEKGDIHYTLDGSEPTLKSPAYTEPVRVYDRKGEPSFCRDAKRVIYDYADYNPELEHGEVDRAFVLRAAAFDGEGHRSRVVNAVYFIDSETYRDKRIISITADYDRLFGPNGICVTGPLYDAWYLGGQNGEAPLVNFWQSGRAWEIEGNIQYLDKGVHIGGQDVGLRVFGGSTRDFALKHFSIYSRKTYSGSDSFSVDFFGNGRPVHSMALRDGISDAVLQELSEGRHAATQEHIAVSVFLNGEYWFDTFACEKYSPAYFYEHKGIAENNIIIVKEGQIDTGTPEDEALYRQIYEFLGEHDLQDESSYEEFCDIIDVQSYVDYILATAYGCNLDQDEIINRQLYRARKAVDEGENDGRWRFVLYDMDVLDKIFESLDYYGVENAWEIDPFTARITEESVSLEEQTLFRSLSQNADFRQRLSDTLEDMIETDYSAENVNRVLEGYAGDTGKLREFFKKRPKYMRRYLREYLESL